MSRISRTVFLSCAIPHISDLYLKVLLEATYEKALEKDALMEVSYELDRLLPASASILDIMETSESKVYRTLVGWALGSGPVSASVCIFLDEKAVEGGQGSLPAATSTRQR